MVEPAYDLPQGVTENTISFSFGLPDPTTLLSPELSSATQHILNDSHASSAALQYGAEQGTQGLINILVEKIRREQNIPVQTENVMVIAGSTHGVDMLARLYGSGVVLVEAPSYRDAIHVFQDHRIELRSVPMDDDGLIPDELAKLLANLYANGKFVSILYKIPNFHIGTSY